VKNKIALKGVYSMWSKIYIKNRKNTYWK